MICDEATSALDVTVQRQIMELLWQLRDSQGISYLFICHNLALVQAFCHRVLVMRQGKIVEEGTADEVILHPKTVCQDSGGFGDGDGITGWGTLMADFLVIGFRECKKDHIDEGIWSFLVCSSWLLCHRSCFLQIRER